jgi:hypothetical protein
MFGQTKEGTMIHHILVMLGGFMFVPGEIIKGGW